MAIYFLQLSPSGFWTDRVSGAVLNRGTRFLAQRQNQFLSKNARAYTLEGPGFVSFKHLVNTFLLPFISTSI